MTFWTAPRARTICFTVAGGRFGIGREAVADNQFAPGIVGFPGAPDFAPTRIGNPGAKGFRSEKFQPGSVGDAAYSPFIRIVGSEVVYKTDCRDRRRAVRFRAPHEARLPRRHPQRYRTVRHAPIANKHSRGSMRRTRVQKPKQDA